MAIKKKPPLYVDSQQSCETSAAEYLRESINETLKTRPHAVLAIPGGRSVCGIFKLMAQDPKIPWGKVHVFLADERLVPRDSPDSNYSQAYQTLIRPLQDKGELPEGNVHPLPAESRDPVNDYSGQLEALGGVFDAVLLSSGEDGHVAALYPNHHSIRDNSEYFLVMNDSPKPPKDRITCSPRLLARSKSGVLLFFGEGKLAAFSRYLDPKLSLTDCPAKIVDLMGRAMVYSTHLPLQTLR